MRSLLLEKLLLSNTPLLEIGLSSTDRILLLLLASPAPSYLLYCKLLIRFAIPACKFALDAVLLNPTSPLDDLPI